MLIKIALIADHESIVAPDPVVQDEEFDQVIKNDKFAHAIQPEEFGPIADPEFVTTPGDHVATPEVENYIATPEVVIKQFVQSPAVLDVALFTSSLVDVSPHVKSNVHDEDGSMPPGFVAIPDSVAVHASALVHDPVSMSESIAVHQSIATHDEVSQNHSSSMVPSVVPPVEVPMNSFVSVPASITALSDLTSIPCHILSIKPQLMKTREFV